MSNDPKADAVKPVTGVMVSQIGYDTNYPKRAILRLPIGAKGEEYAVSVHGYKDRSAERKLEFVFWGTIWQSDWYIADYTVDNIPESNHIIVKRISGFDFNNEADYEVFNALMGLSPFEIGHRILWNKTWRLVAIEQSERRARLAMNKIGWQDCGSVWQEANSHAAYIIGLTDLLEFADENRLTETDCTDVARQIICGADYLLLLQKRGAELGFPDGALSHQIPKFEDVLLPRNAMQAATALSHAAKWLPDTFADKKAEYRNAAERAYRYVREEAKPLGDVGFSRINNGVPADFVVPTDEWLTCDLWMQVWAAVNLQQWDDAARLARLVIERQIPPDAARDGLYGHFRMFASAPYTEKAWTHNIDTRTPGVDAGGHYPHYILPLLRLWYYQPEHPDVGLWYETLKRFAYGYLLPACNANPFGILPLGQFDGEGLVWFAGSWHGMTAIYGLTAALAFELGEFFADKQFDAIATGNLQWIAGLNAGVTKESLFGSHIWNDDIDDGVARPISLIHGIDGGYFGGSWLNVRGAICNGFSVGHQFRFDTAATTANDAPSSFTDEDWITHAGAWLSGIARSYRPLRSRETEETEK